MFPALRTQLSVPMRASKRHTACLRNALSKSLSDVRRRDRKTQNHATAYQH